MSSDQSTSYTRLSHLSTQEQITTKNYLDQNAKSEEIEKPGSHVMGNYPHSPRTVESEETFLYCCISLFMNKEQQREKSSHFLSLPGYHLDSENNRVVNYKENKQKTPNPTTKLHTTSLIILIETLEVIFMYKVMKESEILGGPFDLSETFCIRDGKRV